MTEPRLGSGALRELSEKASPGEWRKSSLASLYVIAGDESAPICAMGEYRADGTIDGEFENWQANAEFIVAAVNHVRAALSLSSPIEPRIIECPDCGNRLEHKGGCVYMHREHPTPQASEVREHIYDHDVESTGRSVNHSVGDEVLIRGTVKRIEANGAPVIVIADRREEMGNWTFQPRDVQASSEVREALTDDEQASLRTLEAWKEQGRMLTYAELLLLRLLPSRQGAANVEK